MSRRNATTQHGKESKVHKGQTIFKTKYLVHKSVYCVRFTSISNKEEEKQCCCQYFLAFTFWIVSCINYEILDWVVRKRKSIDLIPQNHYQPRNHFQNHSIKQPWLLNMINTLENKKYCLKRREFTLKLCNYLCYYETIFWASWTILRTITRMKCEYVCIEKAKGFDFITMLGNAFQESDCHETLICCWTRQFWLEEERVVEWSWE